MKPIIIFDFNRTIYNPETEKLVKNTKFVLQTLAKQGFSLFLISRAENKREDLIQNLGIQKYFQEIVITQEKSLKDFQKIINRKDINLESSFVIGDRVKQEITFGNLLGLQTIWIRKGKFANELPKEDAEQPKFIVKQLKDVLKIVL